MKAHVSKNVRQALVNEMNVSALQSYINTFAQHAKLVVDGKLGAKTAAAIAGLSGRTISRLSRLSEEVGAPCGVTSVDELIALAYTLVPAVPVDFLEFLEVALPVENTSVQAGSDTVLLPEYVGSFRGLGQFNASTWRSLQKADHTLGAFPEAPDFLTEVRALRALHASNKRVFAGSFDGDFSPEVAYLYHNQGAGAAKIYLSSKEGELLFSQQSTDALAIMTSARDNQSWS